jgi:hypothetical protein
MHNTIDVIIRTAGKPERHASLERAIASVLSQQGVNARPVVVANGTVLPATLESQPSIRVHHIRDRVSPGTALGIGRSLVQARYYAFLDDDDELLPHALATALEILQADGATDLAVTTGYWNSGGTSCIDIPDIVREQSDPLRGIIERCWLHPSGALYRTSAVSQAYFEDLPPLCEWTFLAFRLALDRRSIRFVDCPTYVAYDTPGSLSKSSAFAEATIGVLERMRKYPLPPAVRGPLERKYRAALHDMAERWRQEGKLTKAWRFHLKSIRPPQGLRYLAYTRKLVWTT